MKSGVGVGVALGLVVLAVSFPAAAGAKGGTRLETYTLEGDAAAVAKAAQGVELAGLRRTAAGIRADAVLTADQRSKAQALGVSVKLTRNKKGQTVREQARAMAVGGYNVWRSWDEPGGIRDDLHALAARNPQLVKLEVLGHTYQGRELIALKVTQGAQDVPDGSRPAVLYSSNQHAREWISLEVNRRLMHYFIDRWRAGDPEIRGLLKSTELWFVISANPDGYQYTFDHERLWRKNLRDNNGDGQITVGDGVDPNRNYDNHWNFDNEGSSSDFSSDAYRGPSANSEPETVAEAAFLKRMRFKFMINYHTFGPWILYPTGYQTNTATADDPIYYALAGNRDRPAIPGFVAGISADVLYITNGELDGFAQDAAGTLGYTPELNEGCPGCGFVFPDDEALVQAEFEKGIPFALSVAKSAQDPDDPVSSLGIETKPF